EHAGASTSSASSMAAALTGGASRADRTCSSTGAARSRGARRRVRIVRVSAAGPLTEGASDGGRTRSSSGAAGRGARGRVRIFRALHGRRADRGRLLPAGAKTPPMPMPLEIIGLGQREVRFVWDEGVEDV